MITWYVMYISFRNPPKHSKNFEPSSDSLLRNTPEKQNMTQVKGRRKENKKILKERKKKKRREGKEC